MRKHELLTWGVIYAVWLCDILTTVVAVGFHPEYFSETNPLASFFFSYGPLGWIIWCFVCALIIGILVKWIDGIYYAYSVLENKFNVKIRYHKNNEKIRNAFTALVCLSPIFTEALVIGHNLGLLISFHLGA